MVYVYELRVDDEVIDVGVSNNLKNRLKQHTKTKPIFPGNGKYYGRTDITIHPISEWPTRKLAMREEGRVKILHGFEWTESTHCKAGHAVRKLTMEQAKEIRSKYIPYKYTSKQLAKEYNVRVHVIQQIVSNQTYNE